MLLSPGPCTWRTAGSWSRSPCLAEAPGTDRCTSPLWLSGGETNTRSWWRHHSLIQRREWTYYVVITRDSEQKKKSATHRHLRQFRLEVTVALLYTRWVSADNTTSLKAVPLSDFKSELDRRRNLKTLSAGLQSLTLIWAFGRTWTQTQLPNRG